MKTYINISYPSKVRFRKKVHGQTSDHVWSFLNLFSKRPREKKMFSQDESDIKNAVFMTIFIYCIGISDEIASN